MKTLKRITNGAIAGVQRRIAPAFARYYTVRVIRTPNHGWELVGTANARRHADGIARDWIISGAHMVQVERQQWLLGSEIRTVVAEYTDPFAR